MSRAVSISTRMAYTFKRVCKVWGMARSSAYNRLAGAKQDKKRPGPEGPCRDEELIRHIRTTIMELCFHGEG